MRDMLSTYLRIVFTQKKKGGNILLHGMPSIDKMELARLLAESLGVSRRHRVSPFNNTIEWSEALIEECNIKQGKVRRKIGF